MMISLLGKSQSTVTYHKTFRVDSITAFSVKPIPDAIRPSDPEFIIVDDQFVNHIMDKFEYWDGFFADQLNTLIIFPGSHKKNVSDSLLISENAQNKLSYTKIQNIWHVQNFSIKSTNISLNHVACGLTSKEVFKILNKKIKKKVGNGQVWLSNKNGTYRFILTFYEDKIIQMQL